MFDGVLKVPLKTFRSFVERIVKTEDPLSVFSVEGVFKRKSMKSFIKVLFRNKQVNFKKIIIHFLDAFFGSHTLGTALVYMIFLM